MKGHLFIVSDILVHDVRIGWQRQALMIDFKVYSKRGLKVRVRGSN